MRVKWCWTENRQSFNFVLITAWLLFGLVLVGTQCCWDAQYLLVFTLPCCSVLQPVSEGAAALVPAGDHSRVGSTLVRCDAQTHTDVQEGKDWGKKEKGGVFFYYYDSFSIKTDVQLWSSSLSHFILLVYTFQSGGALDSVWISVIYCIFFLFLFFIFMSSADFGTDSPVSWFSLLTLCNFSQLESCAQFMVWLSGNVMFTCTDVFLLVFRPLSSLCLPHLPD